MTVVRAKRTTDRQKQLEAMDARRRAAGIRLIDWAEKANIPFRTLKRIRARGSCFDKQFTALSVALRALMREQDNASMLELIDDPAGNA